MDQSEEYNLPTYNIKVVVQQTNLNVRTIRTWERRYGLPLPRRATGGHRLYSQHDIDTLRWLMARQAEGLSIGNAAELWRALEAKGENPLLSNAPANVPLTLLQEQLRETAQSQEQNEAEGALSQL